MNTDTGEIRELTDRPATGNWIPVKRDLTAKEKADLQIRLYSPCGCGSGKKFKFCCKTNPKSSL
jgi:uncharacterized protein YchJ